MRHTVGGQSEVGKLRRVAVKHARDAFGDPAAVERQWRDLPHWHGPEDVFHLMSIVSPVDRDLLLVYAPLMPVPFREALISRSIELVEVPAAEFDTLGCNVLAVAPREVLMLAGNPETRARLERVGVTVREFAGREICLKGGGGPTCLTGRCCGMGHSTPREAPQSYIGAEPRLSEGAMSRTILAATAAVFIGLAACGGGKAQSTRSATTRSTQTGKPATSTQKKKTTAKADTTRQKNPLTNN